jgi:hypothetical protein
LEPRAVAGRARSVRVLAIRRRMPIGTESERAL